MAAESFPNHAIFTASLSCIAIIGPPNAGKSTLVNALLGRPISITSNIPGTTRDWVDALGILSTFTVLTEAGTSLDTQAISGAMPVQAPVQLPAIFIDTAGIRLTVDPIEHESIRRTHAQRRLADAMIVVLDGSQPPGPAALDLLHCLTQDPALPFCVLALNKSDCSSPIPRHDLPIALPTVHTSALRHQGIQELITTLMQQLDVAAVNVHEPFAFTLRQRTIIAQSATTHTIDQTLQLLADL